MNVLKRLFGKSETSGWQQITEQLADAIAQRLQTPTKIAWGPDAAQTRIMSTSPGGSVMNSFVGNVVTRCEADPSGKEAIFTEHINTLVADMKMMDEPPGLMLTNILPVVKPAGWLQQVKTQLQTAGASAEEIANRFVTQPLADDLIVVYVNDTEQSMSYLGSDDMKEVGLNSISELHAIALQNLRSKMEAAAFEGGGGRYAVRLDDNYDASLVLLMEDILPRININGTPVIALPSRAELMICGHLDAESVSSLSEIAAEIYNVNAYAIAPHLYTWENGQLAVLKPA
jgi:uncharacterized protein YtpQ (UPF0354 family)